MKNACAGSAKRRVGTVGRVESDLQQNLAPPQPDVVPYIVASIYVAHICAEGAVSMRLTKRGAPHKSLRHISGRPHARAWRTPRTRAVSGFFFFTRAAAGKNSRNWAKGRTEARGGWRA